MLICSLDFDCPYQIGKEDTYPLNTNIRPFFAHVTRCSLSTSDIIRVLSLSMSRTNE